MFWPQTLGGLRQLWGTEGSVTQTKSHHNATLKESYFNGIGGNDFFFLHLFVSVQPDDP